MIKLLITVALISVYFAAHAAPVAVADKDGTTMTLYDEECKFKNVVELPYRMTWKEKGKTYEGCFTVVPGAGVVLAYFEDKSLALIPANMFRPMNRM